MSKILALEASTELCSVSLLTPKGVDSLSSEEARSHSQLFLPFVDQILLKNATQLSELDAIACSRGPGSFTGLRICFSVAQGLAFGAELPMITECSLMVMAHKYAQQSSVVPGSYAICVLDARMDQVYWAAYIYDKHMVPVVDVEPRLQFYSEAASEINGLIHLNSSCESYLLGAGVGCLELTVKDHLTIDCSLRPKADSLALLACNSLKAQRVVNAEDAELVYLRDTVSWQKRQRIRG